MIYTDACFRAVRFAIKTHEVYQKQKRKGKDIPYITHPMTVGMILAKAGCSEDLVIAGLLHDTIEDSIDNKKVTRDLVMDRFGSNVADLVMSVTEQNKDADWYTRKKEALEHIQYFNTDEAALKSADTLANVHELYKDWVDYGDATFSRFGVSKNEVVQHYIDIVNELLKHRTNPLLSDLEMIQGKLEQIL